MDAIRVRRYKMIGHVLRYSEESHNVVIERMIESKKTAGRSRYFYEDKKKTAQDLKREDIKEKASVRIEFIGVVN